MCAGEEAVLLEDGSESFLAANRTVYRTLRAATAATALVATRLGNRASDEG